MNHTWEENPENNPWCSVGEKDGKSLAGWEPFAVEKGKNRRNDLNSFHAHMAPTIATTTATVPKICTCAMVPEVEGAGAGPEVDAPVVASTGET